MVVSLTRFEAKKEGRKEKGDGFKDRHALGRRARIKEASRLLDRAALQSEAPTFRIEDPVRVFGRKHLVAPEQFKLEHTGQLLTSLFLVRTDTEPIDGAQ